MYSSVGCLGSARTWYLADRLGSVRATANDVGTVLATASYDPYGGIQGSALGTFGFTGALQQGGNIYLRARWYDAGRGRFTASDPFEGWGEQPYSLHPYQYGYADPTRWTDPTGKSPSNPTASEGTAIHKLIQADFLAVFAPGHFGIEHTIPFASKENLQFRLVETANGLRLEIRGQRTYRSGKVDIIDFGRQQIYEIKHIPSETDGRAELYWYLSFLPGYQPGILQYPTEPRIIGPWPTPPWNATHDVRAEIRNGVIVYWGALNTRTRLAITAAVISTALIKLGEIMGGSIVQPGRQRDPGNVICPVPPAQEPWYIPPGSV